MSRRFASLLLAVVVGVYHGGCDDAVTEGQSTGRADTAAQPDELKTLACPADLPRFDTIQWHGASAAEGGGFVTWGRLSKNLPESDLETELKRPCALARFSAIGAKERQWVLDKTTDSYAVVAAFPEGPADVLLAGHDIEVITSSDGTTNIKDAGARLIRCRANGACDDATFGPTAPLRIADAARAATIVVAVEESSIVRWSVSTNQATVAKIQADLPLRLHSVATYDTAVWVGGNQRLGDSDATWAPVLWRVEGQNTVSWRKQLGTPGSGGLEAIAADSKRVYGLIGWPLAHCPHHQFRTVALSHSGEMLWSLPLPALLTGIRVGRLLLTPSTVVVTDMLAAGSCQMHGAVQLGVSLTGGHLQYIWQEAAAEDVTDIGFGSIAAWSKHCMLMPRLAFPPPVAGKATKLPALVTRRWHGQPAVAAGGECDGSWNLSCDDNDPCTQDRCSSSGTCQHPPWPDGTPCGVKLRCQAGKCVACKGDDCDAG